MARVGGHDGHLTTFNRVPQEGALEPAFRLWAQVVSRPSPEQAASKGAASAPPSRVLLRIRAFASRCVAGRPTAPPACARAVRYGALSASRSSSTRSSAMRTAPMATPRSPSELSAMRGTCRVTGRSRS